MTETTIPVGPEQGEYPPDLQAALEQVYATARPYSDSEVTALRAALTIALTHIAQPEPALSEPIVMIVEAGSTTTVPEKWWVPDSPLMEVTFEADKIVVACPHCFDIGDWCYVEDGTEYRKFYTEELVISEDSDDFMGGGGSALLCQSCHRRCAIPAWLIDAGAWSFDGAEWV